MAVIQQPLRPDPDHPQQGQHLPRPSSRDGPCDYLTMVDHHHDPQHLRPPTPDRLSRSSFSSIRENESALPQDFSHSKISSYLGDEVAVDSDEDHDTLADLATRQPPPKTSTTSPTTSSPGIPNMIQTEFRAPVTHPNSRLLGYWSPADSFQGWKQIQVKGKFASKSFGDLQALNNVWNTPLRASKKPKKGANRPGESPIERLPAEILTSIISLLALDIPPNGISPRNVDLMSLLLTSRTMHVATLSTLYRNITIPHSKIFSKFLRHVSEYPSLGTIVRRLDFCHFNPSQLFSTMAERTQAKNLTSETLLRCLELTPNLQEFLGQEYIDDDLSADVIRKLFTGLPNLKAIDFCGCSSKNFEKAFASLAEEEWPAQFTVTRLSLHKCITLPSTVATMLLPRLARVTHLDLAGMKVTDAALMSLPATARLSHLNLAKCKLLTARGVIDFLANHPAAENLIYLSVANDARTVQLFDTSDVAELLQVLPRSLRSLSIKGASMEPSHIELLRPLTKHLEELAVGRGLKLQDINRLFVPDETEDGSMELDWVPHSLKFLDLSDLWGHELDLVYLFSRDCAILKAWSEPVEVVEVAEDCIPRMVQSAVTLKRMGWRTSECGRRGWMVRDHQLGGEGWQRPDDGRRSWKMGAESWGMRKIPVARAEVGGMYGNFMFSRRL